MTNQDNEKNYRERVSRVVAAILADPMAEHSLDDLARIAHFSPFHFHRIYRSITGETIAATIRRVRLARAAQMLGNKEGSVTDIGMDAGYDSPQAFSRAFQQFSGLSPRDFQKKMNLTPITSTFGETVRIVARHAMQVQALHHDGPPSTIPHTYRRLIDLLVDRLPVPLVGIVHGDMETGDGLEYFAAAILDDPIADASLQSIQIDGGTYALYTLTGPYTQINAAMNIFYGTWLPHSGYEPDDKPALEIYLNSPHDTPPEKLITELLIPVRPINKTDITEK
jgi:AraC family transcriptional regulator